MMSSKPIGQAARPISTGQLNPLLSLHLQPINLVVYQGPYHHDGEGNLILERASRLDAFSAYLTRHSYPASATGVTTGTLEACLSRSSHTRDSTPQVSLRPRRIRTELSHDVLNPARVPF